MANDALEYIWNRYRAAAEILKFEDRLIRELTSFKHPGILSDFEAKVGGEYRRLRGARVWHRAPLTDCAFKGGDRYMPNLTLETLQVLAADMSPKCWIHSLPFGGAKGGVEVDPQQCTYEELMNITYNWVDELNERDAIGPFRDVAATDIGTNPLIMFWKMERYKYWHRGDPFLKAVVTGKPVKLENMYVGGVYGRIEATGFGLIEALEELRNPSYELIRIPTTNPSIIFEGFGNVGSYAAYFAHQKGYRVIGVGDKYGGVYNPCGLDIAKLTEYALHQHPLTVSGFPDGNAITTKELLEQPCDILAPCAIENEITKENAPRIRAKVIMEGANSPTTQEATHILKNRGIAILPDILMNSGGVVVSYFEWGINTNLNDPRIPRRNNRDHVLKHLTRMVKTACQEVVARSMQYHIDLPLAAFVLGLEKAELLRARRIPNYAAQVFL